MRNRKKKSMFAASLLAVFSLLATVMVVSAVPIPPSNHDIAYIGYEANLPAAEQYTFYYTITDDGGAGDPGISHTTFDLDLNLIPDDGCMTVIGAGTWDGNLPLNQNTCTDISAIQIGGDPQTIGNSNAGLKYDDGYSDGEVRHICYSVESTLAGEGINPVGMVDFWVKYGQNSASLSVGGPSCTTTLAVDYSASSAEGAQTNVTLLFAVVSLLLMTTVGSVAFVVTNQRQSDQM